MKEMPAADIADGLKRIWGEALGIEPGSIDAATNFYELGGYSLLAISMVEKLKSVFGLELPMDAVLSNPTIEDLGAFLAAQGQGGNAPAGMEFHRDSGGPESSFALTELQEAYWVGEQGFFQKGGPGHLFMSYACPHLDVELLEKSVDRLVARHAMLRTVFDGNARQTTLGTVPGYRIPVIDLRGLEASVQTDRMQTEGQALKRNPGALDQWPLFHFRAFRLDEGWRILALGRLIIMDGWSGDIFASELAHYYAGGGDLEPTGVEFRDYIESLARFRETDAYDGLLEYWRARIPNMASPPELPSLPGSDGRAKTMRRWTTQIDRETWNRFRAGCARHSVSPTSALFTTFASILASWSKSQEFTLNVMYGNRPPIHPGLNKVIGNFSSTLLVEFDGKASLGFGERARECQRRILEGMSRGVVGGVSVIREMNGKGGGAGNVVAPIVFASGLGAVIDSEESKPFFLEKMGWTPLEGTLSTPQVLFDHQVGENGGKLLINWDVDVSHFPAAMVEDMFHAYLADVHALAAADSRWESIHNRHIPDSQMEVRRRMNATLKHFHAKHLLHQGFLDNMRVRPGSLALVAGEARLTYAELGSRSLRLARKLREAGIGPGDLIAVHAEKGSEQAMAVLAILCAGAAYLPLTTSTPPERIASIFSISGARGLLHEAGKPPAVPSDVTLIPIVPGGDGDAELDTSTVQVQQEDLAYVIYTSGSTGTPKGVAITHQAACNTIFDINDRYGAGPEDRYLALSEINFDLSVYDFFGAFHAGAAIVMPNGTLTRNPLYLCGLVEKERVSIWNSVPAYAEMITELVEHQQRPTFASLRLVLLSGDWIPVALPGRMRRLNPGLKVIGLGGATEAAIWSNYFEIDHVPGEWKSIPYGYPLSNQSYHVLNANLEPSPDGVPGEIFIGGTGLALGYWRDAEKTTASFVFHPSMGERLYRTGDWGRYWADGTLEFLGREDSQVKIRGFRIELGEIESVLRKASGCGEALVLAKGSRQGEKTLAAYLPCPDGEGGKNARQLKSSLAKFLPDYMIPQEWHWVRTFPLTANGKIDRKALLAMSTIESQEIRSAPPLMAGIESDLAEIWGELLPTARIGSDSDFFALGGHSITAVRLMNRLENRFSIRLPLAAVYSHPTLRELASRIAEDRSRRPKSLSMLVEKDRNNLVVCIHPIGGTALCYRAIADCLDDLGYDVAACERPDESVHGYRSIESLAQLYAGEVLEAAVRGKVTLVGWSMGGLIANEMAARLADQGLHCDLIVVDSWCSKQAAESISESRILAGFLADAAGSTGRVSLADLWDAGIPDLDAGFRLLADRYGVDLRLDAAEASRYFSLYKANFESLMAYIPGKPFSRGVFVKGMGTASGEFPHLQPVLATPGWASGTGSWDIEIRAEGHFDIISGDEARFTAQCIHRLHSPSQKAVTHAIHG